MAEIKGDLLVSRTIDAIRINQDETTLTATGDISALSGHKIRLNSSSAIIATLPPCNVNPLKLGFEYLIYNGGVATSSVRASGSSSDLFQIAAGELYWVSCSNIDSAEGVWDTVALNEDAPGFANHTTTFEASDWGSTPVDGKYTMTIPVATHGFGINPSWQVFVLENSIYKSVLIEESSSDATGNIVLTVFASPDDRFAGKIVVD